MNKNLFILFVCIFLFKLVNCQAQKNELTIYGEVTNLSPGINGSIWITTETGNIYFTKNPDSLWEFNIQKHPDVDFFIESPAFQQIVFFNKDTAILYGYISENFYKGKKNKIYRTINGGMTWQLVRFGKEDVWVRDHCAFPDGNIWLSGSNGRLYFSDDYGLTWTKKRKVFNRTKKSYSRKPDMYSVDMINKNEGIVSNLNNQLAVTKDNFKTFQRITTPFDHGLWEKEFSSYFLNGTGRKYINNRDIGKVVIFNHFYIICQAGQMYFSNIENIQWKKTGIEIIKFDVDISSNKLYGLSKNHKIVEFDSNMDIACISKDSITNQVIDMKCSNKCIYILAGEIAQKNNRQERRILLSDNEIVSLDYKRFSRYLIYKISQGDFKEYKLFTK